MWGLEPVTNLLLSGLVRLSMNILYVVCVDSECSRNPTAHILPTDVSYLGLIHVEFVGSYIYRLEAAQT